ncbi:MAG: hypothetical protein KKI09_14030 [Spirochaetes bacterium]|nr:hypothetical protein [Spirochaetota bacterium]MBU0956545.1 hypothetical protein [Spirochaetota bacterium]
MAVMEHRTSFALDDITIQRIRNLALAWKVSQAEVVRRAVEQADAALTRHAEEQLARLQAYHARAGLDAAAAEAWLSEVAEQRASWGRDA